MSETELVDRIKSFRHLIKNWDTYGADPVSEKTIQVALKIVPLLEGLEYACTDWFVVPCNDGHIMFESDCYGNINVIHEES